MSSQQNREQPWRKYIDEESRSVAVIRDKGYSVWSLVGHLRTYRGDKEEVLAGYRGDLTSEELDAALAYYWAKPYGIDEKLREISEDDEGMPYVQTVHSDMPSQQNKEQPWHKYIDEESRRSEAVIRNKGMSVWSVVGRYRVYKGDEKQTLAVYHGDLSADELEAALSYYWANPYDIDRKLKDIST